MSEALEDIKLEKVIYNFKRNHITDDGAIEVAEGIRDTESVEV